MTKAIVQSKDVLKKGGWDEIQRGWDPKRVTWVLTRVEELKKIVDTAYVEISKLLYEVQQKCYWRKEGFDSFENYLESKLQFKDRKGWYFVSIYKNLVVDAKVPEARLAEVEWTLAAQVASLPSEELKNGKAEKWLDKAMTKNRAELIAEVRTVKNRYKEEGEAKSETEVVITEDFYLYPDQHKNVMKALNMAREIASGMNKPMKKGHLLDMICLEFNSGRMEEGEVKLNWILEQVERVFGVECVAIDSSKKGELVVFGNKLAKRLGVKTD